MDKAIDKAKRKTVERVKSEMIRNNIEKSIAEHGLSRAECARLINPNDVYGRLIRPSYETLEETLNYARLPIVKAFTPCNGEKNIYLQADEDTQQFIDICEKIDSKYYCKIEKTILSLIKSWDAEYYCLYNSPSERLKIAFKHRVPLNMRRTNPNLPPSLLKTWENPSNCIVAEELFEACAKLDVSVHWILGLSQHCTVFASNGKIEELLDLYKMMNLNQRKIIKKTIYNIEKIQSTMKEWKGEIKDVIS